MSKASALICLLAACVLARTINGVSTHRHLLQATTTPAEPSSTPSASTTVDSTTTTPGATSTEVSTTPGATSTEVSTTPGATSTDVSTTPGATSTEVSTTPGPTSTDVSTTPGATSTDVSTTPGPTMTEVSTTPGPTVTEVSTTPGPTVTEVSTTPGPTVTEVSTTPAPTVTEVSTTPGPTVTEVSTTPGPSVTEVSTTPGPSVTEVSTTPGPTVTEVSTTPGPTVTEVSTTPGPTLTEVSTTPGPTVTEVSTTPAPTVTEEPTTQAPTVKPTTPHAITTPVAVVTTQAPVVTTVPVPSVTTEQVSLAQLILSALLECANGDLESTRDQLETQLEQDLESLVQAQAQSAQQLMLGIDDFIASEVSGGSADAALVACVVGRVFNETDSSGDVMVTLPPVFFSMEGLTVEQWEDGGSDLVRQSLAAVLLGNPEFAQYVDVEIVEEPDKRRKLLQTASALVVRATMRVPPALAADSQLPLYRNGFDETLSTSVVSKLVSLDDSMFEGVELQPVTPPVERFVVFMEGVSKSVWEESAGAEAFRGAAAKVLTGHEDNSEYVILEDTMEIQEVLDGVAVAFRLEVPAILDTSSWPLYSDQDFHQSWADDMVNALKLASNDVFGGLEGIITTGSTGDAFEESVMQNITRCEAETGTSLQGLDDLDWEQILIAVFMPGMQEPELLLTNFTVGPNVSTARLVSDSDAFPQQPPRRKLLQGQSSSLGFKRTGVIMVLQALGISLQELPRDFLGCVRGLASFDTEESCEEMEDELDAGTITADFCNNYYCDNPGNHSVAIGAENSTDSLTGDTCMQCNVAVAALTAARDLGVLSDSLDYCRSDFDFDDLVYKVGRRTCNEGEEACCVSAGVAGELFHPTDSSCPDSAGCGVAFECIPDMAFLDDMGAAPEFSTAVDSICRIIGGASSRTCNSISYDNRPLCESYSMCRLESVAPVVDICTEFGDWVTECEASSNSERAVLDCLISSCPGGEVTSGICTSWFAITNVLDQQNKAGWTFEGIEMDELVMEVCRYQQLQDADDLLDAGLNEACYDGGTFSHSDNCPIFIPSNLPNNNLLEARRCDPGVHCCVGPWQFGPSLCNPSPTCEFTGIAGRGQCIELADCSTCDTCVTELSQLGLSGVDTYLTACENVAAEAGHTTFCSSYDWVDWIINAQSTSMPPNALAPCIDTRVCPSLCPQASSRCPSGSTEESELPAGSCRTRADCDGDNVVCLPYDVTIQDMSCVPDVKCDPETGFFSSQCLGVCQNEAEAACALHRKNRVEALLDIASAFDPELAANVSSEYEAALEGAESGNGLEALFQVYATMDSYADGLSACSVDSDCGDGICTTEALCVNLNLACNDEEGVIVIDEDFQCTGICEEGERQVFFLASSLTATMSNDGSTIDIEFPSSTPALEPFSESSDEIFEDADEMLGTRSRTYIAESSPRVMTVSIGSRTPFDLTEPFVLSLLPTVIFEAVGGRVLAAAEDDLTFEVAFPTQPDPPMEPNLRYSRTWGAACGQGGSAPGTGKVTIEAVGEMWSDVRWDLESADGFEEEFQQYLDEVNGRPDMGDRLELSEVDMVSAIDADVLPSGEYVVSVTVTSLLGETVTTEAAFSKDSTPLPVVDFGASTINFPTGRELLLSPVQSSINCPSRFSYSWNVTSGDLNLIDTNKASIRIAPEQVTPGASYGISLIIQDADSGFELLVEEVTVVVGVSELQLTVLGADSYRDNEEVALTARLVDPDRDSATSEFDWSCRAGEGGPCVFGSVVPEVSGNKYVLEADSLVPGSYTFTVTATKGSRTAETSIEVVVVDGTGNPPTGSIIIFGWSDFPTRPVDSDTPLKLVANLTGTNVPAEDVAFEWMNSDLAQDVELDTPFLIVPPSDLTPGTAKTFSVRLTNTATEASFTANRTVNINSKPICTRESCVSVTPSEGFAHGETLFSVTASGWEDDDAFLNPNSQWMQYQFGYCRTYGCPTSSSFIAIRTQDSPSYTFVTLPPGRAEDNLLTLRVCALDMHTASSSRLSRTCEDKDIVVTEGDGAADVDTILTALKSPNSTLAALETVLMGQSLVNRIIGNEDEEGEDQDDEIDSLLQVFEGVSDSEDLPPESLGLLTDAIVGAGGSSVGDETRSRGVRILRNVANRLDDVDEDGLEDLGRSIMQGLGAMLGGLDTNANTTDDEGAGNMQDDLHAIVSQMGRRLLTNLLSTEPFLTVGDAQGANNGGAALTVGKRKPADMDGQRISVGGQASRRRLLSELKTGVEVRIPLNYSATCDSCSSEVEVSLSYVESAAVLFGGGVEPFVDAVGEHLEIADTSDITVTRAAGLVNVAMPSENGFTLGGGVMTVTQPCNATLSSVEATLFCVRMHNLEANIPVILGEVKPDEDGKCTCNGTQLGDYTVVGAHIPSDATPTPAPVAPTPTPPPATPQPTEDTALDETPPNNDNANRVTFKLTFSEASAGNDPAQRGELRKEIAKALQVPPSDVYFKTVPSGELQVTVVAESEDQVDDILSRVDDSTLGNALSDFGVDKVYDSKSYYSSDSDAPVGLIVGATIGSIAAAAAAAASIVYFMRRRARVDNTLSQQMLEDGDGYSPP